MNYKITIASFDRNTMVMIKSFSMALRGITQTWYSSLCSGLISIWEQFKNQLITSFQGLQAKTYYGIGIVPMRQRGIWIHSKLPVNVCPNQSICNRSARWKIIKEVAIKGLKIGHALNYSLESLCIPWRNYLERWMNIRLCRGAAKAPHVLPPRCRSEDLRGWHVPVAVVIWFSTNTFDILRCCSQVRCPHSSSPCFFSFNLLLLQ